MPPAYVKPYIRRQKNDVVDAGGDLRGGDAAFDAVYAGVRSLENQADCADASQDAGDAGLATHAVAQRAVRSPD